MGNAVRRFSALRSIAAIGLIAAAPLAAQTGTAPAIRFRADDGNVWRVWDNPALSAFLPDSLSLGVRSPVIVDGKFSSGDLIALTPLFSYGASLDGADATIRAGTSLRLGRSLAFGTLSDTMAGGAKTLNLGVAFRPFDILSLAATCNDIASADRIVGFGVGLRPLAFIRDAGHRLTLTADARIADGGLVMETAGARFRLGGSIDLRAWWDFGRAMPGVELALSLGNFQLAAAAPSVADLAGGRPNGDERVAAAVRFGPSFGPYALPGRKVLMISGYDAVSAVPLVQPSFFDFSGIATIDLPALIEMLNRAAADPSVVAVVLDGLPSVGSLAAQQEFAAALDKLKSRGKRLHVYEKSIIYSAQYQIVSSRADEIAMDPNGLAALTGLGASLMYMKPLFGKLGIRLINLAPWDTKSANNTLTMDAMPEAERAMLERYYGELAGQAAAALAAGRSGKLTAPVGQTIDAGPYLIADQAKQAGLVDVLERRAEFLDRMEETYRGARFVDTLDGEPDQSWGPSIFARRVAVVWLSGNIADDEGQAGASIGLDAAAAIKELREDWRVGAIILRVNSGGGTVLASDNIAAEVRRAVEAGKIVAVSMGDVAASGGYYVSACASRIFVLPGTITGSIGVTGLRFDLTELAAKLGVNVETVATSPSANFGNPFEPEKEADSARYREFIISTYDRFVALVADGRKLDPARVRELGEGQIWTGSEAVANGLADELGGLAETKAWVERELGVRAEFFNVFPGAGGKIAGLLARFGAAAAGFVSSAAAGQSAWRTQLEESFGPLAEQYADMLRLGDGVHYWWPGVLEPIR